MLRAAKSQPEQPHFLDMSSKTARLKHSERKHTYIQTLQHKIQNKNKLN